MQSAHYPYKVAAVYADAVAAWQAVNALGTAAAGRFRVQCLAPGRTAAGTVLEAQAWGSDDSTHRRDTAAGVERNVADTAVPTLFLSAPVIGPMIVLGYGTLISAAAGSVRGIKVRDNLLTYLLQDALEAGCHAIIVQAADAASERRVRDTISDTLTEASRVHT